MKTTSILIRPRTFQNGAIYHLLDIGSHTDIALPPVPVTFVAYDACPAFVIVKNGSSEPWRCPRDQLYEGIALI